MLLTSNPFERLFPPARRRPRPESAAAGPGHGDPSADALHGLRRLLGRVRVRDRRAARRPARRDVGALVAAVDDARVVLPHLGIALGSWWAYYELGWGGWWFWDPVENASFMPWLVGTALIHSLAVTEKRGSVQELDGAARDRRVLAVAARHVPRALGRADFGACVRHRSRARRVHPRVPRARHRRLARAVRLARAEGRRSAAGSTPVSRESMLLANNVLLVVACAIGAARHAVSAVPRCAGPRQDLGRPAVLRRGVRAADGAAGVPDGRRAGGALEARRRCPTCATRLRWALGVAVVTALAAAVRRWAAGRRWSAFGLLLALLDRRRDASVNRASALAASQRRRSSRSCARQPRGYWACCSRTGVAVFIVGVTLVKGYESRAGRADGRRRHASRSAATRSRFDGIERRRGPELPRARAARSTCAATASTSTHAASRRSASTTRSGMPMTEAAIDTGLARRPLRVARRAGRRRRRLERAHLLTSRSSTGSGAAAC